MQVDSVRTLLFVPTIISELEKIQARSFKQKQFSLFNLYVKPRLLMLCHYCDFFIKLF